LRKVDAREARPNGADLSSKSTNQDAKRRPVPRGYAAAEGSTHKVSSTSGDLARCALTAMVRYRAVGDGVEGGTEGW
jgi:hypothetical protein